MIDVNRAVSEFLAAEFAKRIREQTFDYTRPARFTDWQSVEEDFGYQAWLMLGNVSTRVFIHISELLGARWALAETVGAHIRRATAVMFGIDDDGVIDHGRFL